jgi:hypothetical protein
MYSSLSVSGSSIMLAQRQTMDDARPPNYLQSETHRNPQFMLACEVNVANDDAST